MQAILNIYQKQIDFNYQLGEHRIQPFSHNFVNDFVGVVV